jgi:hypothetical protein
MSCMHLMLVIRHVPGEAMMSLMSSALGMHEHASEAESYRARNDARALPHQEAGLEPRRHWSPFPPGAKSGAVGLDLSLVHGVPGL